VNFSHHYALQKLTILLMFVTAVLKHARTNWHRVEYSPDPCPSVMAHISIFKAI